MTSHEHLANSNVYLEREDIARTVAVYEVSLVAAGLSNEEHFAALRRGDHEYAYATLSVPKEELEIAESEFYGWESCTIVAPLMGVNAEFKFIFEGTSQVSEGPRQAIRRIISLREDGRVTYTTEASLDGVFSSLPETDTDHGSHNEDQHITQNTVHHMSHLLNAAIHTAEVQYPARTA